MALPAPAEIGSDEDAADHAAADSPSASADISPSLRNKAAAMAIANTPPNTAIAEAAALSPSATLRPASANSPGEDGARGYRHARRHGQREAGHQPDQDF